MNTQPRHTPFSVLNQSVVPCSNCCFLTCIQVSQEIGKVVWYSHLFKNFSQSVVIHTVKGFSIVNEAEVDVFLEFPCFLSDPVNVGNLISSFSAFSKPNLYIWKFLVHILLKPRLKNFEHNLTGMWNEHNCMVVWTFFGILHLLKPIVCWCALRLFPYTGYHKLCCHKHWSAYIFSY